MIALTASVSPSIFFDMFRRPQFRYIKDEPLQVVIPTSPIKHGSVQDITHPLPGIMNDQVAVRIRMEVNFAPFFLRLQYVVSQLLLTTSTTASQKTVEIDVCDKSVRRGIDDLLKQSWEKEGSTLGTLAREKKLACEVVRGRNGRVSCFRWTIPLVAPKFFLVRIPSDGRALCEICVV